MTLAKPTSVALAASLLLAIGGCAAQTLPGVGDGPVAPTTRAGSPGAESAAVVEYHVRCRTCTVEYTTNTGVASAVVEGSFTRRVTIDVHAAHRAVAMSVMPGEGVAVRSAEIAVDGTRVAATGPSMTDEPVHLNAVVG